MKRTMLLLFLILVLSHSGASEVFGQTEDREFGNFALYNSGLQVFHPAMMKDISHIVFDSYYSRLFAMREFELFSGFLTIPMNRHVNGILFSVFGDKIYSETEVSYSGLYTLTQNINLTGEVNYLALSMQGHPGKSDYSVSPGISISKNFFLLGIRFRNLCSKGNANTETLSSKSLQLFSVFYLISSMNILICLEKSQHYSSSAVLEANILINRYMKLSASSGFNPFKYSAGFEFKKNRYGFLYRLERHTKLGNTSHFGFRFYVN